MIGHLDTFPYADAKGFLDQTEDAQALPFLIEIKMGSDTDVSPRIFIADQQVKE